MRSRKLWQNHSTSALSAWGSWAGPIRTPIAKSPTSFRWKRKPVLKTICALEPEEKLKAFADTWGFESYETDWRKLIARKDIEQIDICTPNATHKEIVLAAAAAGKSIICEKPLAMTVAEAEEMVAAVEKAGVPNLVCFNYRRVPAISWPSN